MFVLSKDLRVVLFSFEKKNDVGACNAVFLLRLYCLMYLALFRTVTLEKIINKNNIREQKWENKKQ